jgi:hypothetical protein
MKGSAVMAMKSPPPAVIIGDRRRGDRCRHRSRPDDQVPGRAQHGVEKQRGGRGVQSDHQRNAGNARTPEIPVRALP